MPRPQPDLHAEQKTRQIVKIQKYYIRYVHSYAHQYCKTIRIFP